MARKRPHVQEHTERRISAVTSISMCVLSVLAQIATTFLLTFFLREKATYVYALLQVAGALVAIKVYQRSGSPSYKLVWMCVLLALPVTGMLLFLLWGGSRQAKNLSLRKILPMPQRESWKMASDANLSRLRRQNPNWGRLAAFLQKKGFLLYRNSRAKYFGEGNDYFEDLIRHLKEAETYIFLEYFIVAEGQVWDRVFSVLKERAATGVEVCLIFDDFGALTRFSDATFQSVQKVGISVEVFNPVHRYVNRIYFNYRDHRKIVVIDGRFAYTGGINLADEYANLQERFGHWKDSAVRIEGEAVWGLAVEFMQMWKMLGRTFANEDDYYQSRHVAPETEGFCQPFTDGPLNNPDNPIEETYLQMINSAKQMLYITTPYYAVEESMQQALCIAADAGVDVRLLVPAIPDKKYAYMVAETYWGELLEHGVKIYKYTPGFVHAKSVLVGRAVALVGGTNMAYRTLPLHYECAVLFYGMPVVEELLEDMDDMMEQSCLYTIEEWKNRSFFRRTFSSILRLFDIWL